MFKKLNIYLLIFLIKITYLIQIKTQIKKYKKYETTETDNSIKEMILFLELKDFKLNDKVNI